MSRVPPVSRIQIIRFFPVLLALLTLSFAHYRSQGITTAQSTQQDPGLVKPLPIPGDKQVALVIGNDSYATVPLNSAVNDAIEVADALRGFGFAVRYKENLDLNGMRKAVDEFAEALRGARVGIFYFAGYGVQVKRVNYLVPVNASVKREDAIPNAAMSASFIVEQLSNAQSETNIVILDACRSNPFAKTFQLSSPGLAPMVASKGTLIAYSAAPGSEYRREVRGTVFTSKS